LSEYYKSEDLPRFGEVAEGGADLFKGFAAWYQAATSEPGALTRREKALIALAVAHVLQCPYCIDSWTMKCLENGADLPQMTEAVHVGAAMRAGASLVHGVQMKDHHDRLSM